LPTNCPHARRNTSGKRSRWPGSSNGAAPAALRRSGTRGTKYAGIYRDPDGHKRSAGTYSSRREALRAANREEQKVLSGTWHDGSLDQITFRDYVEGEWLPHKHLEVTTRAAYNSYLNKQFYPAFGRRQLNKVSPSVVQDWVTKAHAEGLSPRSIKKYHVSCPRSFVARFATGSSSSTRATTPNCRR
jgi:Phage integrase, N-terminal SAM-like domain